MCACMPAIRTLFATIAPKMFGSTNERSAYPTNKSDLSIKPHSKQIKVKQEFILSSQSHRNGSFMELTSLESDDERHIRKLSRPDIDYETHTTRKETVARESV